MFKVKSSVSGNNSYIHFNEKKFLVSHPKEFNGIPDKKRLEIMDTLAYLRISPLASILRDKILFQGLFDKNMISLIDRCTMNNLPLVTEKSDGRVKTKELIENFEKRDFVFESNGHPRRDIEWDAEEKALIALSFGKDSLLCYGLLNELNLNPEFVFVNEFDTNDYEYKHKINIKKEFEKDMGKKVHVIREETDQIYACNDINKENVNLYSSNVLLGYSLVNLNLAYSLKTKYLIFGCEQNLNDSYINSDGFVCYPSYDQSSEYLVIHDKIIKYLTSNQLNVFSPIEPLYNILELFILKNRYPNLLKYIMACYGTESNRWCMDCATCTRMFLYMSSAGINLKDFFDTNLFDKKYEKYYTIFRKPESILEKPEAVRDEQLLAMYFAYRNGFKGYLINKFKQELLDEAKDREDELRKKFMSIHKSTTIPRNIKKQLSSIFIEEIEKI